MSVWGDAMAATHIYKPACEMTTLTGLCIVTNIACDMRSQMSPLIAWDMDTHFVGHSPD